MKKRILFGSILVFFIFSATCVFAQKRPNVILIIVDTLRPDHLGCYGYEHPTSPHIDVLSKESVHFSSAVATIPITTPSHATIFSALYTAHNKVIRNGQPMELKQKVLAEILQQQGYATGGFVSVVLLNKRTMMHRGFVTFGDFPRRLPETGPHSQRLKGLQNEELKKSRNKLQTRPGIRKMPRKRSRRNPITSAKMIQREAKETMTIALEWLSHNKGEPFFLWIHLYDTHWPYLPPEKYVRGNKHDPDQWTALNKIIQTSFLTARPMDKAENRQLTPEEKALISSLYDGEISYIDDQIGRLFSYLKKKNLYRDSVIIFMSDHGETLGDRSLDNGREYYGHHLSIHETSLKIPLLMKLPDIEAKKINAQVRTIDVMPTLLSYLGVEDKTERDGTDLMPFIRGKDSAGPEYSYIQTTIPGFLHRKEKTTDRNPSKKLERHRRGKMQIGIRTDSWKYFEKHESVNGSVKEYLFNLRRDPEETKNLVLEFPLKAEELKKLLKPYKDEAVAIPPIRRRREIDKEKVDHNLKKLHERAEELKSLGYIY